MSKLLFEDTFENFEVNMYNRNAYLTAMGFVKADMKKGMMLGIFGLEGTGKTRLLRAIANFYAMENPAEEFAYITGEELRQELKTAIKRKDIFIFALKKGFVKLVLFVWMRFRCCFRMMRYVIGICIGFIIVNAGING